MPFRDGTEPGQMPSAGTFRQMNRPGAPPLKPDEGLGFWQGLAHPMGNMGVWMDDGLRAVGLGGVADALDAGDRALGGQAPAAALQALDQQKARAATAGRKPGAIGQFVGNAVATAPIMLATDNPWIGGALSGAVSTKDPHNAGGIARDAVVGALAGKAGEVVAGGVARVVQPKLRAAAQMLADQGVQLTPGQMMGGLGKWAEDASTHLPLAGMMIKNAQRNSVETFNRAMINRSLAPIGEQLPEGLNAGREAVDYAATKLGDAFEAAKPAGPVSIDDGFRQGMADAIMKARVLPKDRQAQLGDILQSVVGDRLGSAPTGSTLPILAGDTSGLGYQFNPDAVQLADRELGKFATSYGRSGDPDHQMLGRIVGDVQDSFRDMVGRQDPGYADAIGKAREGWANFVPVRNAASGTGAKEGVFTAGQMARGLARADQSVGKGATARGLMSGQDLVDAAQSVLPSSVPDSGTAGRGLIDLAIIGGLGGGAHAAHISPLTLAPIGIQAAAYTGPALAASRYLLAGSRPEWAQGVADAINQYGRPAAATLGASAARMLSEALQQQPAQMAGAGQ